jgi:hypothetical protein
MRPRIDENLSSVRIPQSEDLHQDLRFPQREPNSVVGRVFSHSFWKEAIGNPPPKIMGQAGLRMPPAGAFCSSVRFQAPDGVVLGWGVV